MRPDVPLQSCKGDCLRRSRHVRHMVTHSLPRLQGIALNFAGNAAPEWVQLTPPGPVLRGIDGRMWQMPDPAAVAAAFNAAKEPQIDIEHASQILAPQGMPAPAVGWMKEINVRDGALWARVEWNAAGVEAVTSRAYRYLSPVLKFRKATGEVVAITSAGLTNDPNFESMAALNAAQQETDSMDIAVLQALGLQPTATAADAVVAINRLTADKDVALNAAKMLDPDKFVPKADHDLALNRITTFEAEAKTRAEAEITAAVDQAVAAGKIAPASKDYHLASCRAEGGLARFQAMVASAPALLGGDKVAPKAKAGTDTALDADQLAMCRAMGMDPKDFAAELAAGKQE
jgi:phage I-like protein